MASTRFGSDPLDRTYGLEPLRGSTDPVTRGLAVQNLRAQGKGIKTIMRELGLAKETVRRFARATTVEDLLGTARAGRPSVLDEFKPYLHHRFNLGHTNGSTLFTEIRGQGYRGSLGTVLGYLRPFRASAAAPPAVPRPPTVRDVVGVLLRHPDTLDADDQFTLKQVRARCPHLDDVADQWIVIGVDPHKASWTAAAVGPGLQPLATIRVPVSRQGYRDLRRFAARWPAAEWAIEGASGLGAPLATLAVRRRDRRGGRARQARRPGPDAVHRARPQERRRRRGLGRRSPH